MEHFDVAVVGAGPSGSATALCLARAGLNVLIVERAKVPGQKNVFGGRIYSYPLYDLLPDWQKDCPVERFISKDAFAFMTEDQCLQVQFESSKLASGKALSFTAIRQKFDNWLAKKAETAGAMLITGTRVDDLLIENGRVKGIISARDKVTADVVVGADGVVSKFTEQVGLRTEIRAENVSVGVKETIELTPELIQERFNVDETSGVAYVLAGAASGGLQGGGFLYTNKDSISLGLVVSSKELSLRRTEISALQERFKRHPVIAKLLKNGKVIEYSTHMIPETGPRFLTRAYADGFIAVGDAAGFLINNGYTFRGVDLAIASGMAAAQTILNARTRGGFSVTNLSEFETALRTSNVKQDLETFARTSHFMRNQRLFSTYPQVACDILEKMYTIDGSGNQRLINISLNQLKKNDISLIRVIRDLFGGVRSM